MGEHSLRAQMSFFGGEVTSSPLPVHYFFEYYNLRFSSLRILLIHNFRTGHISSKCTAFLAELCPQTKSTLWHRQTFPIAIIRCINDADCSLNYLTPCSMLTPNWAFIIRCLQSPNQGTGGLEFALVLFMARPTPKSQTVLQNHSFAPHVALQVSQAGRSVKSPPLFIEYDSVGPNLSIASTFCCHGQPQALH